MRTENNQGCTIMNLPLRSRAVISGGAAMVVAVWWSLAGLPAGLAAVYLCDVGRGLRADSGVWSITWVEFAPRNTQLSTTWMDLTAPGMRYYPRHGQPAGHLCPPGRLGAVQMTVRHACGERPLTMCKRMRR